MSTLLCVPITVQDVDAAIADAVAARDGGADLVEFRVDELVTGQLHDIQALRRLINHSPLSCIMTCRIAQEGGAYTGNEEFRLALFAALMDPQRDHRPRFVDLELSAMAAAGPAGAAIRNAPLAASAPPPAMDQIAPIDAVSLLSHAIDDADRPSVILSIHDFSGRPADLSRRLVDACKFNPAVVKIAFRARSLRDSLELLDLPTQLQRPTISLGMGEFGLLSRVLAPKFGGFLTFAALRASSATAPGQPTLSQLLSTYRFRSISPSTKVYGVVGWPVSHSLSPLIHNAGFEAVGHNGVYLPMPIPADQGPGSRSASSDISLRATLVDLIEHPRLCLSGVSVTLPHKQSLITLAREQGWRIGELASHIGAANTLVIDRPLTGPPAAISVENTDAPAIVAAMTDHYKLPRGVPLDKRVLVVGAGGVARAGAFACCAAGAAVWIVNRDADKARRLAADIRDSLPGAIVEAVASETVGSNPATWAGALAAAETYDIILQCTPLGMVGGPDPAGVPLDLRPLAVRNPDLVVFETVYTPRVTPLLSMANDLGLKTIDGLALFVRQAALQFSMWTGKPAPTALFEQVLRETEA